MESEIEPVSFHLFEMFKSKIKMYTKLEDCSDVKRNVFVQVNKIQMNNAKYQNILEARKKFDISSYANKSCVEPWDIRQMNDYSKCVLSVFVCLFICFFISTFVLDDRNVVFCHTKTRYWNRIFELNFVFHMIHCGRRLKKWARQNSESCRIRWISYAAVFYDIRAT